MLVTHLETLIERETQRVEQRARHAQRVVGQRRDNAAYRAKRQALRDIAEADFARWRYDD